MVVMRQKLALLVFILVTGSACNLSGDADSDAFLATYTPIPGSGSVSGATGTPVATQSAIQPTLTFIPLPGARITSIPVTSVPARGSQCAVYIAFSGKDPANKLSLRTNPDASSYQLFLVPTDAQVLLVPGSEEVEAGGYHWLNVIYEESAQMRYQGWIARDSYQVGGVRNPSIATLQRTGRQAAC